MNTIEFLKENARKGSGAFRKEAQYLRDNWEWMKYSYAIAIKVRHRLKELGWSQKRLAESLGCTQQHISILLNGRVNMTLETLAKLENALECDLIGQALRCPDGYSFPGRTPRYLNEPAAGEKTVEANTSSLVDGYASGKKKGL